MYHWFNVCLATYISRQWKPLWPVLFTIFENENCSLIRHPNEPTNWPTNLPLHFWDKSTSVSGDWTAKDEIITISNVANLHLNSWSMAQPTRIHCTPTTRWRHCCYSRPPFYCHYVDAIGRCWTRNRIPDSRILQHRSIKVRAANVNMATSNHKNIYIYKWQSVYSVSTNKYKTQHTVRWCFSLVTFHVFMNFTHLYILWH